MNMWTNDELTVLTNNYQTVSKAEIQLLLPNKCWQAIKQKAYVLGIVKTPRKQWSPEEDAIILAHWGNKDAATIAREYLPNRSVAAIRWQGKALMGKKITYDYWSPAEIIQLRELYPISSTRVLATTFGRPYGAIEHKALRLGLNREDWVKWTDGEHGKYTYDKTYFDAVDTPDKAYILGLLYADGWNTDKSTHAVGISLKARDGYLLEKIGQKLQYTGPVRYGKTRDMAELTIGFRYFSEQMKGWGLVPNKTFVLTYPTWLSPALHGDFVRGFFDGDGCVTISRKKMRISFVGASIDFITGLNRAISKYASVEQRTIYSRVRTGWAQYPSDKPLYTIIWARKASVRSMYDWMYASVHSGVSDLYLTRKLDKFLNMYK